MFNVDDFYAIQNHLSQPGHAVVISLAGESIAIQSIKDEPEAHRLTALETDGSQAVIFRNCINGYSLTQNPDYALTDAAPALVDQDMQDAAMDAYTVEWQSALMGLRAACEKSADPEVADAVAALEAIELAGPQ